MNDFTSLPSSPDERVMAALAHITVIIPFMGVIAPIIIWATQKEKSRYVAFHALQALGYQLCMIAAWFIAMGCYMCSIFSTVLTIPLSSSGTGQSISPFFFVGIAIPYLVFGVILMGGLAFIVYGIVGAVLTLQGKPFHYILIGMWVEHFMQQNKNGTEGH